MNRLYSPIAVFLAAKLVLLGLLAIYVWKEAALRSRIATVLQEADGQDAASALLSSGNPTWYAGAVVLAVVVMTVAFGWQISRVVGERRHRARSDEALSSLRSLLAAAPLAFIAWDQERGVLLWSDSAARMFGLERDRALGQALPGFLSGLRDSVETALLSSGAAVALQVGLRNERDEFLHLSVSASRMASDMKDQSTIAVVIEDLTPHRVREARRLDALRAQRDALVREVHHRIKNHLQGVAGLLRQHLAGKPLLKPLLEAATAQVLTIAAVHGLQGETPGGALDLRSMVARIAASISGIMHVPIVLDETCAAMEGMFLSEEEAVPMAMVLNEILMNAVKHRVRGANDGLIRVSAQEKGEEISIRVANQGFLPPRFNFSLGTQVGTGLGLVRSLLPTQGVSLGIDEEGEMVVATLTVGPPHLVGAEELRNGRAREVAV